MTQDLSNYTKEYYLRDQTFAKHGILRPDQLAALCYALDWPYWGFEVEFGKERNPGEILSIGCGRGELEKTLEDIGYLVTGVDPSEGAEELYQGSTFKSGWTERMVRDAHTIIFCESIEHIPLEQTLKLFNYLMRGTRVIITNFTEFWPIIPHHTDGWDHITQVDDELYDKLSISKQIVLRRGPHLVLEA